MVIKKPAILFISLFLSVSVQAQIYWLNNFNLAKQIANSSNRLIVVDFWAPWCGPCKIMDSELWRHPEIQKISKNFVGVKINVDLEKSLIAYYKVTGIPKVLIIASSGDIIWEKDGYDNAESFLAVLRAIPENAGELNRKFLALAKDRKDLQSNYSVGIELQRTGKDIKNISLKNSFLNRSRAFLAKAKQLSADPILAEEIELHSILNDVYSGRSQDALSRIEKIDPDPQNEDLAEFRHYILAMCYKNTGDKENYHKEKQQIKKKEFLDQLED